MTELENVLATLNEGCREIDVNDFQIDERGNLVCGPITFIPYQEKYEDVRTWTPFFDGEMHDGVLFENMDEVLSWIGERANEVYRMNEMFRDDDTD